MEQPDTGIEQAREAAARGAWAEAYRGFHSVERSTLTGRDLEGLADASWWISRFDESIDARQRAYAAFAAEGDDFSAAAAAARLAIEHFVRGVPSVGAGYLKRAQRHARTLSDRPELGLLMVVEATVAHFSGDLDTSLALSRNAIEVGQRFGNRDLLAMAIHTEGLTLIDAGHVPEGLALLDEAMALVLAGDLSPYFTGIIYCNLIGACLQLSDIRRAGEWSDAAEAWCETLSPDAPFPGMCRLNRAEVARLRGAWPQAEAEAVRATEELATTLDPGLAANAFVQLGEVRRRLGDDAGADDAFARAQELGGRPQPGLALLRLAQGKVDAARTGLVLAVASEHQPSARLRLLSAQVEVAIAAGELDEAVVASAEIDAIARDIATPSYTAAADTAAGAIALAKGEALTALDRLRSACVGWQELRLPYETAKARVLCAQATRAAGDEEGARLELRAALAEFRRLGAVPDGESTERLLDEPTAMPGGLTAREIEVLRLVAAGKTNRDIAVELVISEHTVARHLQNMFAKMGVSSRAAATAFAFEHDLA